MVDGTLRWVLRHEKRAWIVITLTFVTGILLILPAVEEYTAAKERSNSAREKLDEAKLQMQNLPQLQRTFEQKRRELKTLETKAVSTKDVAPLREMLVNLIRETGCSMRGFDIKEAPARTWMTNDSPIAKTYIDPGPETPFQLINHTANLQIEGPMASVYQFMARASQLDRFIHVTQVKLERSQRDENVTQLDMQFEMFDLVRKKSA